jgi:hypothetical protein
MWIVGVVLLVLVLGVAVFFIRLPSRYVMYRAIRTKTPADQVWATISDPGDQRAWRKDLSNLVLSKEVAMVEKLSTKKLKKTGWIEVLPGGLRIKVDTTERTEPKPKVLIMTREPEDKSFRCEWTFRIDPQEQDSQIVLMDSRRVEGLKRRIDMWMSSTRGQAAENYLTALSEKLGDAKVVSRLRRTEAD